MGRRCKGDALRLDRSWVWTADAERRWLRAFRLLLDPPVTESDGGRRQEQGDGQDRGRVCMGLDETAGGAADDSAALTTQRVSSGRRSLSPG